MLQIQTKNVDICRLSKLFAKFNVKANLTSELITIDGDISEKLLEQILSYISIDAVQNFKSEKTNHATDENKLIKSDLQVESEHEGAKQDMSKRTAIFINSTKSYDLLYSKVKRGEMYWCDLGEPFGHEKGFIRPVIIVQNNVINVKSPNTTVIPCTTSISRSELYSNSCCFFSSQNMIDHNKSVSGKKNVIEIGGIRNVDKTRLRGYIGTLKPEFMEMLQEKIDFVLGIGRKQECYKAGG